MRGRKDRTTVFVVDEPVARGFNDEVSIQHPSDLQAADSVAGPHNDRQDHVPQKNLIRSERKVDALVGIAGVRELLALRNVSGDRNVLARSRTLTVDDVDIEFGVGILVVVVRVKFDSHASQNGIRDRRRAGRDGPNLGAYAVIVAIVLVENNSIEAVDIRIERREHGPVIQSDGEGVIELPRVARFREDVYVHRGKQEFLNRDRL